MFAIFSFVIMDGILMQMRGSVLPEIQETFGVSESLLGLVAPAFTVSLLIALLLVGMRTGTLNIKKFLMLSIAITGGFTFLIGTSFAFPLLLILIVGRGVGTGIFRGLDRPVLSHLFPENRGWTFNMHTLAWAVGATSGPMLAILFLKYTDWRTIYLSISLGFLPIILLFWKIDLPTDSIYEKPIHLDTLKDMFKNRAILGMMAILFLNGGIEGGFFTWLPYFANEFLSRSFSNLALTGFLAGYIPGRYIYGRLSQRYDYTRIVLVNAISVSILIFLAFFVADGVWRLPFIFACGFPISGIFPTMLAMGTDIFPQFSGPMNAIGMGAGMIGISIIPWIMGVIADFYTVTTAMRFMLAPALVVILATLIMRELV